MSHQVSLVLFMVIANENNYFRLKIRVCGNYQAEVCLITLRFILFGKEEKVSKSRHPIYKLLTRFCIDKIWNEMHHTLQRFEGFYQKILSDMYPFWTSYSQSSWSADYYQTSIIIFAEWDLLIHFTLSMLIGMKKKMLLNIPNA